MIKGTQALMSMKQLSKKVFSNKKSDLGSYKSMRHATYGTQHKLLHKWSIEAGCIFVNIFRELCEIFHFVINLYCC